MVDIFFELSSFDRSLTAGMPVLANWSQGGFCFTGKARIVKLRRESVEVELISTGCANDTLPIGKTLEIPRFSDQTRWSSRNCVQPLDKTIEQYQ